MERIEELRRMSWGHSSEQPTQITEWLYVGGNLRSPEAWSKWFAEHPSLTHVVNCAAKDVRYAVNDSISLLKLEAVDEEGFDLFSFWPLVKSHVAEAKAVLFHCQAGINRSAALAVAALCVHEQRPFLRVLRDSLQRRPGMLQNRSFKRQLIHCIRTEGLLDSEADLDWWSAEVEHYQKQVHQVFQLFAQDNSADFDLFKELLHEVGETAIEDHWHRMKMHRPLLPLAGGTIADAVDEASAERWFRSDAPEVFEKLIGKLSEGDASSR